MEASGGLLVYRIGAAPGALPPVLPRDLERAWRVAGEAARAGLPGPVRRLDFAGAATLLLQDRDARCWAAASDRVASLGGAYGLSLCLRLLALVDALARAGQASASAEALRAASRATLTDAAGLPDSWPQRCLGAPRSQPTQGAPP